MDVGVVVPSGLIGEYDGWHPADAWARALELARLAEDLRFAHVWVADHLHGVLAPAETPTFEAFTLLTAIAEQTTRVRLGPGVACAAFRNPALLVKMAASLDVASGGRLDLALGAGWFEPEWRAYGYGFPPAAERLAILRRTLEVATAMLGRGSAVGPGDGGATAPVCVPAGLQTPRIRIVVGGNGQKVTWRLAARFADELNLDGPDPEQLPAWRRVIQQRCAEVGRDPATLDISAQIWWKRITGQRRVEALGRLADEGLDRIVSPLDGAAASDEAFHAYAEDCRAAGLVPSR
jgi:alkanesulfonate monooxygenase SsuD/methylene tetrahydromethanopterin reductase-like flavin-dependent oxidoreductase (luciferase family)